MREHGDMSEISACVVSIHVASESGGPTRELTTAELLPGRGIVSDRHFDRPDMQPEDELTLIESEEIEALNRAAGLDLEPGESRRNVVTRGVRLNQLVGKEFRIGNIRLLGIELCEPCAHLAGLLAGQGRIAALTPTELLRHMAHRAGLRAQILNAGYLKPGDPVFAGQQAGR